MSSIIAALWIRQSSLPPVTLDISFAAAFTARCQYECKLQRVETNLERLIVGHVGFEDMNVLQPSDRGLEVGRTLCVPHDRKDGRVGFACLLTLDK